MHGSPIFQRHARISITGILCNHCTEDYVNMSLEAVLVLKNLSLKYERLADLGKKGCNTLLEDKKRNIYLACRYNWGSYQDLASTWLQAWSRFPRGFSTTLRMGLICPNLEVKNKTSRLIILQSLCSQPRELGTSRRQFMCPILNKMVTAISSVYNYRHLRFLLRLVYNPCSTLLLSAVTHYYLHLFKIDYFSHFQICQPNEDGLFDHLCH